MDSPPKLERLSIVIPALNEAESLPNTLNKLYQALKDAKIPHEILVVDDGSTDASLDILSDIQKQMPELTVVTNPGDHGFGRAVIWGLKTYSGDAVVIYMADASDAPEDVVQYWQKLNEGWDCVFGSRFIRGSNVTNYPWLKLMLNRLANQFIKVLFHIRLNDTTNAFKAYRREVIDGCHPLFAPHFNFTVELPLKAIIRGFSWTTVPISWRNRTEGVAKLKIKEMGSRYLFIVLYLWLEKYFSRGDFRVK